MRVGSSSMPNAPPVVAMGASGSGKSTIGGVLADALGVAIFDGDSRHRPRPAVRGQDPSLNRTDFRTMSGVLVSAANIELPGQESRQSDPVHQSSRLWIPLRDEQDKAN